jgi:hypothetical protein
MEEKQKDCPSLEDLNSWYDKEATRAEIGEHVENCDACQAKIESFEKIDEVLSRHLAAEESRLRRIERTCRDEVRRANMPKLLPTATIVRIAAMIAAAFLLVQGIGALKERGGEGGIAAELNGDTGEELSEIEKDMLAEIARSKAAGDPGVREITEGVAENVAPVPRIKSNDVAKAPQSPAELLAEGSVAAGSISLVSTNTPLPVAPPPAAINRQEERSVGDRVHHVWLVDDATNPLQTLKPLMPSQGERLDFWISQNKASYRLHLTMSDRDLQGLVNKFGNSGYTLISPAAPQPGLVKNLEFSGKTVTYQVDFVKK